MPVIIIGADTALGDAAVDALVPRGGEVRAFVTDRTVAASLRQRGVKVAIGDVSDGSHVGGAAMRTFCAVVIPTAAVDDRERSFASTPARVVEAWAEGLADAGVRRAIWVEAGEDDGTPLDWDPVQKVVREFATVRTADRTPVEIAAEIARLDAAAEI